MSEHEYVSLLKDPFDDRAVKFLDGRVMKSSAVKCKTTGTVPVNVTYFFIPVLNSLLTSSDGTISSAKVSDLTDDLNFNVLYSHYHRLVNAGLRMRLLSGDPDRFYLGVPFQMKVPGSLLGPNPYTNTWSENNLIFQVWWSETSIGGGEVLFNTWYKIRLFGTSLFMNGYIGLSAAGHSGQSTWKFMSPSGLTGPVRKNPFILLNQYEGRHLGRGPGILVPPPVAGDTTEVTYGSNMPARAVVMNASWRNGGDDELSFFEAVRLPVNSLSDFAYFPLSKSFSFGVPVGDITNYPGYQKGYLKDIGNYVFKLNRINNDYKFTREVVKTGFDVIMIRLSGNVNSGARVWYDVEWNQEIVYEGNLNLSKFHTDNEAIPGFEYLVSRSNEDLPGVLSK
jgi:hypothetical protein